MVYVFWPVFSSICGSLSQTDPGIQHKRFNTTYHWPISPRLRRIILKQAGSARSQGAKGGYQWLDREDFFPKKGHFHIGWLQELESVAQQFVAECFVCCLCFLPSLLPAPEWIWMDYLDSYTPGCQESASHWIAEPTGVFQQTASWSGKMGCQEAVPMVRMFVIFYLGCPLSEGGFGQSHLEVLGCFGVSDSFVFLACTCDAFWKEELHAFCDI